jgi:hypothetical protein
MTIKIVIFLLLLSLYSGCAMDGQPLQQHLSAPENSTLRNCAELFVETEQAIIAAGVIDSQAVRIAGYPYLRVNRFLSDYRHEVSGQAFESWISGLQELATKGWQVELMNLPANARQKLQNRVNTTHPSDASLIKALHTCGNIMRNKDLDETAEQNKFREKALVPAEYQTWQQIAGLYPITAMAFRFGIWRWHQQTLETYHQPLQELQVKGQLILYTPAQKNPPLSQAEVADIIKQSSENPLNSPFPRPEEQKRLFDTMHPVFEIDTASEADKIGSPVWQGGKYLLIDTSKPIVYRHLSHARMRNQTLLQLNYTIWFPSRPKSSSVDLLGGHLDGITWRVTLLPDGKPWLFDAIHNCGCYHLFFPTQYANVSEDISLLNEPAFMPQQALTVDTEKQTILRIASASHTIQRVYFTPAMAGQEYHYQWDDADSLRSLPLPDGNRRGLFGQDGIVAGSERGERFLFWPMGIPNPGAMRQWGHHATAFVGRRHFDEPHLFEKTFDVKSNNPLD